MDTQQLLNIVWTCIAAFLVFFMQAGFAMVETGFTRAKNSSNIIMKNLMDFVLGSLCFFLVGFALMFGGDNPIVGTSGFFHPTSLNLQAFKDLTPGVFMIFHTVFCATAATIVSGAMAERTKFSSYLCYSALISLVVYPITGHWIWGGGWLANLGFHDFAGSTAVHSVGGWLALVGAATVGPRIGKFKADGTPKAIPGHNIALGALGVFILWFCWFGFNCGSTTAATDTLGSIAMTTNLAACAATLVALIITWVRYGKPDVSMTLNGSLAGLVGVTAGCDAVSNYGAILIGIICGCVVVFIVELLDKVAKIDDPVGACGVHLGCGVVGTLLVGPLATNDFLTANNITRMAFIKAQFIGVGAVGLYCVVAGLIIFNVIKATIGLRASEAEEIIGMDISEHGVSGYADFAIKGDH
ncbi:MAG: ammonium transporter [Anaerostipes sp.]|nr:ammonium transporter [Anaerostipes sp.]